MQREVELRIAQAERKQKDALTRQQRADLAESVWRDAGVLKRDGLRRSFLHIAPRADLPDMTNLKNWRHAFATLLQEANVDLLMRQLTLGHKPPTSGFGLLGMTTIYTHTSPAT